MSKLIVTSQAELETLIQESIRKVLLEEKNHNPSQSVDEIFALPEAVVYLKISKPTMYRFTSKRLIPFNKVGKKLLFRKSDLDQWLNQNRRKSVSEIKKELEDGNE